MRLLCLLLVLCTGCGYRFGSGALGDRYHTVCIPYVEGDWNGILTAALIHRMSTSGGLGYVTGGADLVLKVCLFEPTEENIGFISLASQDEENVVLPNEARLAILAKVSLIDRCTGCCILGPVEVTSSLAFDFESDLSRVDFHNGALGQLQMYNLAKEEATPPLYDLLAQKIVDYVNHGW